MYWLLESSLPATHWPYLALGADISTAGTALVFAEAALQCVQVDEG
jgi:hypothetical protein